MAEPQVQYAKTSDGVNIAYSVMGDGPPLLRAAIPGITHAQRDWAMYGYVWEPLTRDFRVVLYDSRGTGLSDRDVADFSVAALERDLEAVVEKEDLETFAMAGLFDTGVRIAVTYAAAQPERVSHLVLAGGSARAITTPAGEAAAALMDKDWRLFTETFARVLVGTDDAEWMEKWAEHFRASCEPDTYRRIWRTIGDLDVTDVLSRVLARTLVVHNEVPFVPLSGSRELAARIPGARLAMLADPTLRGVHQIIGEFLSDGGEADATASPVEPGAFRTILFTDIEGSTSLTQRLGDAKAQEALRTHNTFVRDALNAHSGTETKHTGDGIMASFTSASAALSAAVAIQKALAGHNEGNPDVTIRVRIGLNAGEPVAEDEDLFGTAVQLAARVCDRAEPGQILASNVVQELAAGKGFTFVDKGEATLKGFDKPVRLHEVRWRDD